MKIPLLWLKDYVATEKSAREIAASFTQLGLMLDKPLDNNVLDLEHRMDRSDWLSIIGCARDFAAFEQLPLTLPKVPYHKPAKSKSHIPITVQTAAVRRFQTRLFRGIKVGPSPAWLANRLTAYGIDPVNNIVDITNFVMVEYGQTSHAQDIARLPEPEITLRPAKNGETLTTLLGTKATLTSDDFVLSSGGKAIVIGGIVGGVDTGVTAKTTDIILDAGNYDSRAIRRSSRRLKIINESVSRNDKILDPRLIDPVMNRLTDLILTIAGGTYYANDDYYPHPPAPQTVTLHLERLRSLSGLDLTLAHAKKALRSLGYVVTEESNVSLTLEVPYFRTDIEVEDDLIGDILRMYNYANIPTLPLTSAIPPEITPPILAFEDRLRDLLVDQGLHEHINNSLTTFNDESGQVKLANALSSDQNALRTSLLPNLRRVLTTYDKHKVLVKAVFELGLVFTQNSGHYHEHRHLSVVSDQPISNSLATLMSSLGISSYQITNDLNLVVGKMICGNVTSDSYTVFPDVLLRLANPPQNIISTFIHPQILDISLLAPVNVTFADINTVISSIKVHWDTLICQSYTVIQDSRNYLLTITWSEKSSLVDADKKLLLSTLQSKLNITSKS